MIELLKQISISIAVVGFGLAVLLPAVVQLYIGAALAAIMKPTTFKDKFSKFILLFLPYIGVAGLAAFIIIPLYYIWIG